MTTLRTLLIDALIDDGIPEPFAIGLVNNLRNDSFFRYCWTGDLGIEVTPYDPPFLSSAISYVLDLADKEF